MKKYVLVQELNSVDIGFIMIESNDIEKVVQFKKQRKS